MEDVIKRFASKTDLATAVAGFISLISLIALVISYVDHLIFYSFFGIPISNYVQIIEAVVLFLPNFINYIINTSIFVILFVLIIRFSYGNKASRQVGRIDVKADIRRFGKYGTDIDIIKSVRRLRLLFILIKRNVYSLRLYVLPCLLMGVIFDLFFILMLLMIYVFGIVILSNIHNIIDDTTSEKHTVFAMFFLCFFLLGSFLFLFNLIKYLMDISNVAVNNIKKFEILELPFMCFIIIFTQSYSAAYNIRGGNPVYEVEFTYNNKSIRTNKELVYVGGTQSYVFLRDRKVHKNLVYKNDKIENFTIEKINYSTYWIWDSQYHNDAKHMLKKEKNKRANERFLKYIIRKYKSLKDSVINWLC